MNSVSFIPLISRRSALEVMFGYCEITKPVDVVANHNWSIELPHNGQLNGNEQVHKSTHECVSYYNSWKLTRRNLAGDTIGIQATHMNFLNNHNSILKGRKQWSKLSPCIAVHLLHVVVSVVIFINILGIIQRVGGNLSTIVSIWTCQV